MKKREPVRKKDNVIYFPELEKRLTEKGLESLKTKRYNEAIHYLEGAKELDPENEDILIGLVLAYFEAGAYQKAKDLAKEMLLLGMGDYFQMVDLYLTILIQLHEYTEIVTTIEALLEEWEIPPDRNEHFLNILQFSRRMAENEHPDEEEEKEGSSIAGDHRKELKLYSLMDPNEQMLLVSELTDKNIRPYLQEIQDYLRSDLGHPFFKTMLLNLLKDQDYDQEVMVHKFKLENSFVPNALPEISSQPRMETIIELVKEKLENNDPILFQNIKSLVERHFLITYPFILEPLDPNAWAAGFHFIALQYYGDEPQRSHFTCEYDISIEELEAAVHRIKEIEEISYPII
ncbi:lipopolysaccharide assembly protein LapB [Bacillus sp. EB600]|uniref:tetratricopeptide repeat protein n=1 Tax=Bacillus sp. EB600 TaxID=2806345 RepID=UPI00210A19B5|nr:tetratricopeptide repeat protein [Bacillus sp. EB600]MCQ6278293.1 tetratricopeptide repeat protein [Bacillus sp. EB600]